ncbi:MAG: response regulator [Chloroflexi bacterium]|nr:response regulator [Chloroflexota bacterium]
MKLKDIQIGTQLRLGLGLIVALGLLLGALAWRETNLLWLGTKTMYDHPLQVRRAVGSLEEDSQALSRYLRDLFLAKNDQEVATALQNIESNKVDVERQLEILSDRYLGPQSDIFALQDAFIKRDATRAETIRMLQDGYVVKAAARHKAGGAGYAQAKEIRDHLQTIDDFALNKANQLYHEADALNSSLTLQLAILITATLLLSLAISYVLLRAINDPLRQITAAAEQFREGKLDARSGYVSANEFGTLSATFDALADTIQADLGVKEGVTLLADIMARETELRAFCRALLATLIEQTGSQIGAIYLHNPQKNEFEHFESIGLAAGGRTSFSVAAPEGEFGAALATGQLQRITDIPEDTRFTFAAVSGDFTPREIITIPLLSDRGVTAVLSLASLRSYDASAIRFLEDILSTLTARLNGVLAFQQIREQTQQLELQNRELEVQSKELVAQANELTEQNTELEMQKKQLDDANRLKSTFLSNMSHELRTPLNSVIALSGVLNRRLAKMIPEEEYSYLEVIERNGRHLLALINDVLDLSRIESGREELSLQQFSMRALVAEIVDVLEPQARQKNLALLNQVGDDLPPISSDPGKCRHILQNLIANAVKFTDTGTVEISAQQVGAELHVVVRDTGIGIAAEKLPTIFDEFRQVDDSAARKYGGTGLGLSIAKKYAALLQGTITVESTPGQGSIFTLHLPMTLTAAEPTSPAEPHDQSAATPTPGQGKCILLVEDNEPAVIQMTDILSAQGYQIQVARNGREALAQIEQALPDAVILDLMMPDMDGFEVLQAIRNNEKSAHLPVLILTARHVTNEELSFLNGNNVHQLIQKGAVSKRELLAAIAQMVVAPPPEEIAKPGRKTVREPISGRQVILVVEDNPDNMTTVRVLLQATYTVLEAADGRAGIEQARMHKPDLILMDLALPIMDGFAALAAIREDEALRHIPVVAVTATAMKGDREEILARGFDGYISKPIDAELLRKTIQELLHGS